LPQTVAVSPTWSFNSRGEDVFTAAYTSQITS
jgi:hypothetical protein